MELRQIRHFIAIAEHKNFGRAAEALHITQQALSHSIAQLERNMGVRLFDRGQFGAELTAIGTAFLQRAKLACAELELGNLEVSAMAGGAKGHVRIGVSSMVASRILPRVIIRFVAHRPGVGLSVTVDHSRVLYDMLERGELEFLVSTPNAEPSDHPELVHESLGPKLNFDANFLVMRAGHPLLSMPEMTVDALHATPWVMPESLSAHTRLITDFFQHHDLPPPPTVVRTDSFFCAKALVAQSDFVALLGAEAASAEIEAGMFTGIRLDGFSAMLPGFLIHRRRSKLQPAARELVRIFRHIIDEQGPIAEV